MAASRFHYRNGELFCEDVPLRRIAEEVGTPAYVYSLSTVKSNLRQIQQAFPERAALVCYALKANSNPDLVRAIAEMGAGGDVVSGGELAIALAAGIPADRIVFAGVGKTENEIRAALEAGVLALNVESLAELDVVERIALDAERRARVALRLNPDVDIHGHPYLTTGRGVDKFGIALDQMGQALDRIRSSRAIELVGLHCHVGSQVQSPDPYLRALETMLELVEAARRGGLEVHHLDIGGGIGVRYEIALEEEGDCLVFDVGQLAKAVLERVRSVVEQVLLEPGRAIVANAGTLLCRVLYTKSTGGRDFVVVDGAMNDFIRPALYGATHRILPVDQANAGEKPVDVVGPVCESGDFFARQTPLPDVRRGDYLAVMGVGAYGYVLASNYNARPRAPEVIVEGDQFWISRPRETDVWGFRLNI